MKKQLLKLSALTAFTIFSSSTLFAQQQDNPILAKVDVKEIEGATVQIKNLEPITYSYSGDKKAESVLPAGTQYGFKTESVRRDSPELIKEETAFVNKSKNTSKALKIDQVNNDKIIPILVAALKEQQEQIEELQRTVQALKSK